MCQWKLIKNSLKKQRFLKIKQDVPCGTGNRNVSGEAAPGLSKDVISTLASHRYSSEKKPHLWLTLAQSGHIGSGLRRDPSNSSLFKCFCLLHLTSQTDGCFFRPPAPNGNVGPSGQRKGLLGPGASPASGWSRWSLGQLGSGVGNQSNWQAGGRAPLGELGRCRSASWKAAAWAGSSEGKFLKRI